MMPRMTPQTQRMLRALSRFDMATVDDVGGAVACYTGNQKRKVWAALQTFVAKGLAVKIVEAKQYDHYQITDLGRECLVQIDQACQSPKTTRQASPKGHSASVSNVCVQRLSVR